MNDFLAEEARDAIRKARIRHPSVAATSNLLGSTPG